MAFVNFPRPLNEVETFDLICDVVGIARRSPPPSPRYVSETPDEVEWREGERLITIKKQRGHGSDHGEFPCHFEIVVTGVVPPATLRLSGGEDWWSSANDRFVCEGVSIWDASEEGVAAW